MTVWASVQVDDPCRVESCQGLAAYSRNKITGEQWRFSPYCSTHRGRAKKFGSPTPNVSCFDCGEIFQWVGPMHRGRSYCDICISILTAYSEHVPPSEDWVIRAHGLTIVTFVKMLVAQSFCCKLCGGDPSYQRARLTIDHDHQHCAGKFGCRQCVRGLLCTPCNLTVGHLERQADPQLTLENMGRHINKHKEANV